MMALEAGAPVVPVAISGSREVLPKHSLALRRGTIRVRVLPPIETAGRGAQGRDALMAEVRRAIERGAR
jgi:1-acyl-sn-glycerol-3-phosphate acyltransferase